MWWEGGGRATLFLNNRGGLEIIFFVLEGGVRSKFLLDNSSFSAPHPLLIIIAQSLTILSLYYVLKLGLEVANDEYIILCNTAGVA